MPDRSTFRIAGTRIARGETRDLRLKVSETYTGDEVTIPLRIIRAKRPGPVLFVSAAIHGDEINGVGIIREFIFDHPPELKRGTLICMPVVNVFGFDRTERYLPDRRDLNRSFPGSDDGSLASRIAHTIFEEVVRKCDFGIDLHSAAIYRTNFPNVRGDLHRPEVRQLAEAFGCELAVHGKGPEGTLRRAACNSGCPTIILEAGEVAKIEPSVVEMGVRGLRNVLAHVNMIDEEIHRPVYQTLVYKTFWVRAEVGGLLRFHVAPGDVIDAFQPIATIASVFGEGRDVVASPRAGIVLGMTTYPAIKPGEPVCHIAVPRKRLDSIRRALQLSSDTSISHRLRQELATSVIVDEIESRGAAVMNDRPAAE